MKNLRKISIQRKPLFYCDFLCVINMSTELAHLCCKDDNEIVIVASGTMIVLCISSGKTQFDRKYMYTLCTGKEYTVSKDGIKGTVHVTLIVDDTVEITENDYTLHASEDNVLPFEEPEIDAEDDLDLLLCRPTQT